MTNLKRGSLVLIKPEIDEGLWAGKWGMVVAVGENDDQSIDVDVYDYPHVYCDITYGFFNDELIPTSLIG